ncbi:MAG: ribose 5-phosphate isomerase B [Bernardetiaceae bacterium]
MKLIIGSDHAGYAYKQALIDELSKRYQITDVGPASEESVDYPDFAHPVAQGVAEGNFGLGILICGSGNGVSMTANKYTNIRAALCWQPELATLARQHNAANVLCLPARFVSVAEAKAITEAFLAADFEGGRHERRVKKIPATGAGTT